jgi:hypothetical protein
LLIVRPAFVGRWLLVYCDKSWCARFIKPIGGNIGLSIVKKYDTGP